MTGGLWWLPGVPGRAGLNPNRQPTDHERQFDWRENASTKIHYINLIVAIAVALKREL